MEYFVQDVRILMCSENNHVLSPQPTSQKAAAVRAALSAEIKTLRRAEKEFKPGDP
jgi:hypothetical protein